MLAVGRYGLVTVWLESVDVRLYTNEDNEFVGIIHAETRLTRCATYQILLHTAMVEPPT